MTNENRRGCEPPFSPRERQGVLLDNVHIEHLFMMLETDERSACHRDKIASLFRNIIFYKIFFKVEVCSPLGLIISVLDMCRYNEMNTYTVFMSPQIFYFHKYF